MFAKRQGEQRSADRRQIKSKLRREAFSLFGQSVENGLEVERVRRDVRDLFSRMVRLGTDLSAKECEQIENEVIADVLGFGPLDMLMRDPATTEIMVNGPFEVYAERHGRIAKTDAGFDDQDHLYHFIERLIRPSGRRVDESKPTVDFSLADGSRVNVVLPPVGVAGPYLTIRKSLHALERVEDLVAVGTMDCRMAELLVKSVQAKLNIMFSGAAGSGKTTLAEVLSAYIGPEERIVTIEDTLELRFHDKHVVRLLTRQPNIEGRGEISIRDLFINSLRMRPHRIILGEVRGAEAFDLLQALNSGHTGAFAVIHASSPADVLLRLESMAFFAGIKVPATSVRALMAHGLDLIVQIVQMVDGSRKIVDISEVAGLDESTGEAKLRQLFVFKHEGLDSDGKVVGRFEARDVTPVFMPKFERRGIALDSAIFNQAR